MTANRNIRYGSALPAFAGLALGGCGDSGGETHPVAGRLEVAGGDAGRLVGHHVELARDDDPAARAAGAIDAGGRFRVETLDRGRVKAGARAGRYRARLVLADEGDATPKPKVPRQYLDFKTSGWAVEVPAAGDVTLTIATK